MKELINRIRDLNPSEVFLNQLLPKESEEWIDAIDYKIKTNPIEFPLSSKTHFARLSVESKIYCYLGHIDFDRRFENKNSVLNSYAFYEKEKEPHSRIVNYNEESAKLFSDELIKAAKIQSDIVRNPKNWTQQYLSSIPPRLFIVKGKRGCGKSFFFDYLLFKYTEYFSTKKTFFINLNLNDHFGRDDLMFWVYAQISKILVRFYDTNSDFYVKEGVLNKEYDFKAILNNLVAKNKKSLSKQVKLQTVYDEVSDFVNNYSNENSSSEPLTYKSLRRNLAKSLFNYMISEGFSFITVLDGLDSIEAINRFKEKFRNLTDQALTNGLHDKIGMAFVLVTRTMSIPEIQNTTLTVDPRRMSVIPEKDVVAADVNDIIVKRFKFIEKQGKTGDEKYLFEKYMYDMKSIWQDICNAEDIFSEKDNNIPINSPAHYNFCIDMFGENRRAQMQLIQSFFFGVATRGMKTYRFIEAIAKAGEDFIPKHYYYKPTKTKTWDRNLSEHLTYDNKFLPSIFCFPYLKYYPKLDFNANTPHKEGILLPYRIIQIVHYFSIYIRDVENNSQLFKEDIQTLCNTLFGYPNNIIEYALEDLIEYEFITIGINRFHSPIDPSLPYYHTMPKSFWLTNRKIIKDIAYLNLASMRIPFRFSALDTRIPIIKAEKFDNYRNDDIVKWVVAKITNSITLNRIISIINKKQKKMFQKNRNRLPKHLFEYVNCVEDGKLELIKSFFSIPGTQIEELLDQIQAILMDFRQDSAYTFKEVNDRVIEYLDAYYS